MAQVRVQKVVEEEGKKSAQNAHFAYYIMAYGEEGKRPPPISTRRLGRGRGKRRVRIDLPLLKHG